MIPRDATKDRANPKRVNVQNTGFQAWVQLLYISRRFEQFWKTIQETHKRKCGNATTPSCNGSQHTSLVTSNPFQGPCTFSNHPIYTLHKNRWRCPAATHKDYHLWSLIFVPLLQTPTVLDQCLAGASGCWAIVATFHSYSPQLLRQIQQWQFQRWRGAFHHRIGIHFAMMRYLWCFTRRARHRVSVLWDHT